jgi:hypothetical protein
VTFGVQTYDGSAGLVYDTTTALGGAVVGDYRKYASGAAGETINYTQWAGLSAMLIDCGNSGEYVSLDMSGSYPVVTVTTPTGDIVFGLMVY